MALDLPSSVAFGRRWRNRPELRETALVLDPYLAQGAGPHFGLPLAPVLKTAPLGSAYVSVTSISRTVAPGTTARVTLPPADAYFMMLYLDNVSHADIGADGEPSPVGHYPAGTICLVDLQQGAAIALHSTLHSLAFTLPKSLLAEVAELTDSRPLLALDCVRGHCDPVIKNIGMALVPLFAYPHAAASAVLQHIAIAICDHLLGQYARACQDSGSERLSPRQQMIVQSFMRDNMAADLTLSAIAETVGMSPCEFSRLFKEAMGITARKWLLQTRLERAKDLLSAASLSMDEICQSCGFAELAAFDDAFAVYTGLSPESWRQAKRH